MSAEHKPVLLAEVVSNLLVNPEGIYIDATFGRGGHTKEVLKKLTKKGLILVIDKDPQAIEVAQEMAKKDTRIKYQQGSFSQLMPFANRYDLVGRVDGIMLDLGVSSPQLDQAERGFSFSKEGPLDMRMDPTSGVDAASWINSIDWPELAEVFKRYGEERYAKRIAKAVVAHCQQKPIVTTSELAKIIAEAHPAWEKGKNPATRCFQAIRIFINDELAEIQQCLEQTVDVLKTGGRLAVISFHSLEDRIVKQFIYRKEHGDALPRKLPIMQSETDLPLRRCGRSIKPGKQETQMNPRARSAILRIAEKKV